MASTRSTSAARRLAALGHSGYGESFARRVLATLEAYPSLTASDVIYGGRDAAQKLYEARGW